MGERKIKKLWSGRDRLGYFIVSSDNADPRFLHIPNPISMFDGHEDLTGITVTKEDWESIVKYIMGWMPTETCECDCTSCQEDAAILKILQKVEEENAKV